MIRQPSDDLVGLDASDRSSPAPPLPLLVTGIAGVAGYNAFHYFRRLHGAQVIGTRRSNNWPIGGDGIVPCDVDDHVGMLRLFDKYGFRSVLNCEGTCKLKSCELDPAMAERINVLGVRNLLDAARTTAARIVHLSIDLVYSGDKSGGHVEEDPVDPVTIYGKTMAQAEQVILREAPSTCILRISLPMGISFNGHAGAIDWIQSRFKKDKPATLYYDELRTPTYTDCLNPLFAAVLASDFRGLYHAGASRRLSLYQIAQIVNRVGGYDPVHLMGCLRHEAGPIPPRAGDVTMNSSKLSRALGYDPFDPWPLAEEFVPTHRKWHHERSTGTPGSPKLLAEMLYRNPRRPRLHLPKPRHK